MSRLRIVHTSMFRYTDPVVASYNEARMTPLSQPGQSVLETRLDIHPQTWMHDYRDYWGTQVTAFEVLAPHQSLLLTAEHLVEVVERPGPSSSVGWDVLHGPEVRDRLSEHLADTTTTEVPEEVAAIARRAAADLAPSEAAEAVCLAVRDELEYIPGVTTVHTPAAEAWTKRTGVCQDMAHLTLGALRSVGIPARYVSGYLHPDTSGEIGATVTGESHAWVEWWTGEWTGYDPTNRVRAGEQHVVLGRGRCYDDVPPLRGIYAGLQTQDLVVKVKITREA
ncbi:transglutaminase family protein [Cellulomonas dongxiuzhuiae]|uniref:Transglutaminase family protein n=1 Tax=Cellulomonas dongxiuzhuiae TaxID=2819979 RepID=A0ABX8GFL7_9CELL|nr:transglutaminase family protein [Cellulomonas dongxiuzhuiae]MBO3086823.1 transglutaminase family protein [Cellulomonas dongxiuzhuiae]MBO3093825.1 transglutaminase family protein [Cellulomonas dongxiuzhuiae]QWC14924.1 transglutaminase family protein [Cellulomonas dongxiuzhuiae]